MSSDRRWMTAAMFVVSAVLAWQAAALDPASPTSAPAPVPAPDTLLDLPMAPGTPPAPPVAPAAAPQPAPTPGAPPLPGARAPMASPNAARMRVSSPAADMNADASVKYPNLLFEPPHLGNTSLMFSASDMNVIIQGLDVYDNSAHQQKTNMADNKDDLSNLLESLKAKPSDAAVENAPLPNLYLGSIVYYSPAHWSVWINGKKLISANNAPTNEFYIDRLSRTEVELIWKPAGTLQDIPPRWQQMTNNGEHPLANITVNESKGTVMLHLRPNQTFLPRSLTIREGLIRARVSPSPDTAPAAVAPGAAVDKFPGDGNLPATPSLMSGHFR